MVRKELIAARLMNVNVADPHRLNTAIAAITDAKSANRDIRILPLSSYKPIVTVSNKYGELLKIVSFSHQIDVDCR